MVLTTLVILIICSLIGGSIYYFINRPGTISTPNALENPVLSQDVSVQSTTETGAAITWTTDRPASGQVIVRDSSGAVVAEITSQETSDTSHSAEITGLKPNTTYHYTIVSTDEAGNESTSEGKLQTSAVVTADKTPPTIRGVNASNVTEFSAIITWTTNEPATSQVKFEKNENVGSATPIDKNLTTNHSIRLVKLDSGAIYSFSVISRDAAGNEAVSTTKQTFKTLTPIPVGNQVGNRAPDFALKDLNGRDVRLSDFRGKTVMINFWAVWCGPCKDELPFIQAVFKERAGNGVMVLAIAVKNNERLDTVEQYIKQTGYTFPVLFDVQGQVNSLYNVGTLPTTFFIDTEGIIRKTQVGSFQSQASLETIIDSLK